MARFHRKPVCEVHIPTKRAQRALARAGICQRRASILDSIKSASAVCIGRCSRSALLAHHPPHALAAAKQKSDATAVHRPKRRNGELVMMFIMPSGSSASCGSFPMKASGHQNHAVDLIVKRYSQGGRNAG